MNLKANIRKYFIHTLTTRRNFIPILSIYFMTFPDNIIRQLWFMTWIGSLAGFLLEIPSGYFADRFGHKKTLILAKIFLVISTSMFIIWWDFWIFALGSLFMAFWHAFNSGTKQALLHETLTELGREKEYTKISSKIWGNVSLISVLFIVTLPFFTQIDFRIPFMIGLAFDVWWLINSFLFIQPKIAQKVKTNKSMFTIFKEFKNHKKIFLTSIFFAITFGIYMSVNWFRWVYLESIGFPVILIGLVMGLSRLVWRWLSKITHIVEARISINQLMFFEIFLYSLSFLWISLSKNLYVVWAVFILISWYQRARMPIVDNFILKNLKDKQYKATILSMRSQVSAIISFSLMFILWFIMEFSYTRWFLTVALLAFVGLSSMFVLAKKVNGKTL